MARGLSIITAAVVAAASLPAGTALAQKGPAASDTITLRVCNNTNQDAKVAISYQPVGHNTFYNEGWFDVRARTCENLAETTNAYMYGFANVVDDHDSIWGGDHPLCVEYPGPYEFWTTTSPYCEPHQESRDFQTLQAQSFGVFTWNLDS